MAIHSYHFFAMLQMLQMYKVSQSWKARRNKVLLPTSSLASPGQPGSPVLVPQSFRSQVLSLAHDNFSGHLGIKKTYQRILCYLFSPGLKSDVTRFCRSCHVCQISGKPNQTILPTPLQLIPVLGAPFERIILDCVWTSVSADFDVRCHSLPRSHSAAHSESQGCC